MNKKLVLDKLELLVKLCEKTEPDVPSEKYLFNNHLIQSQAMLTEARDLHIGKIVIDPDSEGTLLTNIMKQANKIWRIRNKIKNGEWDDLGYIEMTEQIEDYIAQKQKINAIKYYRQEMGDQFNEQVSLREAKEHIDKIADDMRLRGMVR
jgi:predicted aldo/keto reductase-like oxidoreductase